MCFCQPYLVRRRTTLSQTEKEAISIVWACEKFHLYIYGGQFNIIIDHKALETILNNNKSRPPAKIERWNLHLQNYNFTTTFRPGKDNPTDYMSRHPVSLHIPRHSYAEEYINFLCANLLPIAMRTADILHEINNDITMQSLKDLITSDSWYKLNSNDNFKHGKNIQDLLLFSKVKQDLTVTNHGLVLKGTKLVITEKLRDRVINLVHEGHQRIIKTKALIREKIWFPGIDRRVEIKIKQCLCQSVTAENKFEPLEMTELPEKPWDNVSIDFSGPYPTGKHLLVIMDDYSRFSGV